MQLKRLTIELTNGLQATLTRSDERVVFGVNGPTETSDYTWEVKRPGYGGTGRRGTQREVAKAFRELLATLFGLSGR